MIQATKRQRRLEAQRLLKKPEDRFAPIDLTNRPHPDWMTRAYQNNRYCVMVNDNAETTKGTAIRVMVQKHTDTPIVNHWSEMQRIKNEIFGSESVAIEYYPAESELVNRHNIYWMWLFDADVLPKPLAP